MEPQGPIISDEQEQNVMPTYLVLRAERRAQMLAVLGWIGMMLLAGWVEHRGGGRLLVGITAIGAFVVLLGVSDPIERALLRRWRQHYATFGWWPPPR